MNRKLFSLTGLAICAAIAGGVLYFGGGSTEAEAATRPISPQAVRSVPYGSQEDRAAVANQRGPAWARNAKGHSYGSLADAAHSGTTPDLVSVIASNGVPGYVQAAQFDARKPGQSIPVYDETETRIIGSYNGGQ